MDQPVCRLEVSRSKTFWFQWLPFKEPSGCRVVEHIDGSELVPKHEAKRRFRDAVLSHFNHHCAYCFEPLGRSPTLDHVVPKAKGGNSELNNLVACCFGCNMSKGHKDWRVWYRSLPFWSEIGEARIMDWITRED